MTVHVGITGDSSALRTPEDGHGKVLPEILVEGKEGPVVPDTPAHARCRDASAMQDASLLQRYREVRAGTHSLVAPLSAEDCTVQSMTSASPAKWHLAHTTWFFERFVLARSDPAHRPFHPDFEFLFNSYYNAVGPQHARESRGLLSRPALDEATAYRTAVDERMLELLDRPTLAPDLGAIIEIGLNHEQQHQELLVTDAKHLLSCNPLRPAYNAEAASTRRTSTPRVQWLDFHEGVREIGHQGGGFAYDCEGPRHKVFVGEFHLADRLVTSGEYLAFMADGGYERPELWLDAGWREVQAHAWRAPLYWEESDTGWHEFTLGGMRPIDENAPVTHVSLYEADAYARWAGCRLPTEAEWEIGCASAPGSATCAHGFLESQNLHPVGAPDEVVRDTREAMGEVWQWTGSQFRPYPGYRPPEGAIGEYNAKFMCDQFVLRGASCATPRSHARITYRNFFAPDARWQFSGIRLAKDVM